MTSVEFGERDFRDVEKALVDLPGGSCIEWALDWRANAPRLNRPGGRGFRRWTGDREVGTSGLVLDAQARFDREVEGGRPPLPLSRSGHGSIGRGRQSTNASFARHRENRPCNRADSGSAARVTTPLALASDTAASRRSSPGARHSPVTGAASKRFRGPAERIHLPTGVHRHRARRGPALGDASSMARFAVAGRACGLCGQLIRDCEVASSGRRTIITVQ